MGKEEVTPNGRLFPLSKEIILVERVGTTLQITLNRPAERNALNLPLRQALGEAVFAARDDNDIKAVVLTGAGGAFCAGGDIKSQMAAPRTVYESRERIRSINRWFSELLALRKPVIAAVNGPAAGGGFALAMAADFVVVTPTAYFAASFVRIGLLPDMSSLYLLPRTVGLQRAKEIIFSGRIVRVEEALRLGIAAKVVSKEALISECHTIARHLQNSFDRTTFGKIKAAMGASFHLGLEHLIRN
jgi:2-(1,2-epoxy-1,2-dihydrophenyl)acetyl-CoA isomerase